jgi:hypothetical protein
MNTGEPLQASDLIHPAQQHIGNLHSETDEVHYTRGRPSSNLIREEDPTGGIVNSNVDTV